MSKSKVLIVEDDAMIAEDLQDILVDAGYDVVGIAHNAKKAIDVLSVRAVDLVFLDVTLSDNSTGVDVANYINDHNKIPFIFLTSYSDADTVRNVVSTNPGGYLVKPFGKKNNEIANELFLSINTIKTHIRRIYTKLNVNSRVAAVNVVF